MELGRALGIQAPAALSPHPRVPLARRPHSTPHETRSRLRSAPDPRMVRRRLRRAPRRPRDPRPKDGQGEVRRRPIHDDRRRLHPRDGPRHPRRHEPLPRPELQQDVRNHRRRPLRLQDRRRREKGPDPRMAKLLGPVHARHRRHGHAARRRPRPGPPRASPRSKPSSSPSA